MNRRQKLVQQRFLDDEEAVIKRLKTVYNQSLTDINKKVNELDSSIAMLQKALKDIDGDDIGDLAMAVLKGKNYTPQEAQETIRSMLQSKVYQKKYQAALQKQVGGILDKMQDKEFKVVADYLDECYTNGFVGTMYDLQGQGIPLCFPLDQEQMVRAVQLDSKISKGLYTRLGEDISLLKKKIAAQVSRGISTGMSYQQVAQQLAGVSNIGFNNAVRIARTEGHRIQCQAGMDACYKAKERGADVVKKWDSTLDAKTRESHIAVDGEIRELDKPFSNGLMFPSDPNGAAAEVINCRCALLQDARWALEGSFTKMNNFTKQIEEFDGPEDYEEFKKAFFSKENRKYMNYVEQMEDKYKTKDFSKVLAKMSDREYNHYSKLLRESPLYNNDAISWKDLKTEEYKQKYLKVNNLLTNKGAESGKMISIEGKSQKPQLVKIGTQFFASKEKQFGKKVGKHAKDYGLDPSKAEDRAIFQSIIDDITSNAENVRIGYWRGQPEDVLFYIKGEDVVITDQQGEFISILKGGISNERVKNARNK